MDSEQGKVFVGGISWETTEERMKKHFETYGDVVEVMIMRDRNSGRSRGFGFVFYLDSAVADRVVQEKHTIDGRLVEVKKAVPRDDQHGIICTSRDGLSPVWQTRTKLFVGGLASNVTEIDFREYFQQFGTILDAVVMHDQTTQRPRGFGFVTYELEDVVNKVMTKTFHELKGKVVEVKRAIPKEQSTFTSRVSASVLSMALSRGDNFGCGFGQGCISGLQGNFGGRMNLMGVQSPGGTGVFLPYSTYSYGRSRIGGGYWPGLLGSYGGRGFGSSPVYGGPLGYTGNSAGTGGCGSPSVGRSMWSNGGIGCGFAGDSTGYEFMGGSGMSCFSKVQTWDSMPTVASQGLCVSSGYCYGSHRFSATKSLYSSDAGGYMGQGSVYGIRDPQLKLNPPEPRPLAIGYGPSNTVIDDIANYGGPLRLTGRQPDTGVPV